MRDSLHRYLLLFAALVLGCSVILLLVEWRESATSSARRLRASDANRMTLELLNLVLETESSQFAYLLTGDAAQLSAFERLVPQLSAKVTQLEGIESPDELRALRHSVEQTSEAMRESIALRGREGTIAATDAVRGGRQARLIEELRAEIASLSQRYFGVRNAEATRQQEAIQRNHAISVAISLGIFGLLLAATHRIDAFVKKQQLWAAQLAIERDSYQRLADHMERVREEERAALARELHDDIGQMLTVLQLDIGRLESEALGEDGRSSTARLSQAVSELIKKTRDVATMLRPPILDSLGVVAAIEWHVKELSKRVDGVVYSFGSTVDEIRELSEQGRVSMFRIAQEALTNALRHSSASRVDVRIYQEKNTAVLEVQDNGSGFGSDLVDTTRTFGLAGMEERARLIGAQLTVESERGQGVLVRLSVPLVAGPAAAKAG